MASKSPLLEVRDLTKVYSATTAVDGANLTLERGEVRALLGENGAGKSTLIKMLGGLVTPTRGSILINGETVSFAGSRSSQDVGISVVSQEFRLVPQLSVAENIFLGYEPVRLGFINHSEQNRRSHALLEDLGLDIDPARRIDSLTIADRQLVEIARSLSHDFSVLVLDEPTAALNQREVDTLLNLVNELSRRGKAVLYVSHRLPEVLRIAQTATILRDGVVVADMEMSGKSEDDLIELMLGRSLTAATHQRAPDPVSIEGTPALVVDTLSTSGLAAPISLDVRDGEVLGIAGLVGSGRTELMRALFGLQRFSGRVTVDGNEVAPSSPAAAIRAGIFMLGEDRKSEGILPHLTVLENMVISEPQRRAWNPGRFIINRPREAQTFATLKDRLRVRVDRGDRPIGSLSGGNQQKVLFARASLTGCRVLLLNEPTRGVDVGAKVEIYELIHRLASAGTAVIVSSSEAAELAAVSNRCLVLYAGQDNGIIPAHELNEDRIVAASLGKRTEV